MKRVVIRAAICLLVILLAFTLISCNTQSNRVISNDRTAVPAAEQEKDTAKQAENPESVEENSNKPTGEVANFAESLKKESEKSGKRENAAESATENQEYKGYKGPVQGELKYKEGTPADENSREYKASGDIESPYHVELIVTRDYGYKKMYAETVGLVKDEVGMEVLFRNLDIQTAYGGGFINAINGLESGYTFFTGSERKKLDWFYWVNGILGSVGIAEYRPQPGDVIWWDYHDWGMTMFIPAVIGSYPQPFKNGFWGKNPGTIVMYAEGYREEAEKLQQSLLTKGVKQVDITSYNPEVLKQPEKYYLLLGTWEKLSAQSDYIKDINLKNKLVGVYVKFEDNKLKALNFKGKVINSYDSAGAIYAFGSSIGSLNPLWIVTGSDDAGVRMALDTLLNKPEDLHQCFGAVVSKNGVENVPYAD